MEKIDNLDRKILNIVMRNARIASKDVALDYYLQFVDKGADTSVFEIPKYSY